MNDGAVVYLKYVAFAVGAMFVLFPVLRSDSSVRWVKFAVILIAVAFISCVIDAIMYDLSFVEAMKGKTVTTWGAFGLVVGLFAGGVARTLRIRFFK